MVVANYDVYSRSLSTRIRQLVVSLARYRDIKGNNSDSLRSSESSHR